MLRADINEHFQFSSGVLTDSRSSCTAGLSVHVILQIHFVEGEGIKFETNRLHFSRQEHLVYVSGTYQIFDPTFFSRVGLELLISLELARSAELEN